MYWPREGDTETIETLGDESQRCEEEASRLREESANLLRQIDILRTSQRPTFPTAEQDALIGLAVEEIRKGTKPSSHHGDPVEDGNYIVVVDGSREWMSVRHDAPYSARGSAEKLWSFSDEETEAILEIVRANGLTVLKWWHHGDGISITTNRPERSMPACCAASGVGVCDDH